MSKTLAIVFSLLLCSIAQSSFQYSSEVQKSKYFNSLAAIESTILSNCIPAKTLDFLGTSYVVAEQNGVGFTYTVHYDLILPEKTLPSALSIEISLAPQENLESKKPNILVDRFSLCR